jgi:hypothetical protein
MATKQFKEKRGTLWLVTVKGDINQRILLSATSKHDAEFRVLSSFVYRNPVMCRVTARPVLYAIAGPKARVVDFTFVPKNAAKG